MKIILPTAFTAKIGLVGLCAIMRQLPTALGFEVCRKGKSFPIDANFTKVMEAVVPDIWPATMEFIASRNLSRVSYNSCSYSVMTVGEVCDANNATDCFRVASYGGELCASVTPCGSPNGGVIDIPFAANCSGISADFPDCQLVCYDDAANKNHGYGTCVAAAPTSALFPTSSGWNCAGGTTLGGALGTFLAVMSLML